MSSRLQEWTSSVPLCTFSLLVINISIHIYVFLTSPRVNLLSINPYRVIYGEDVRNYFIGNYM